MSIESEIKEYIVENILFGDGDLLENDTPFQSSGILDSTGFLEVLTFIEGQYQISISDSEVVPENFDTLRRISQFVQRKVNQQDTVVTP